MPTLSLAYYLTITGRISRSEYWLKFQLPIFVISFVIAFLAALTASGVLSAVSNIVTLVLFVINIMAGIRRYHDRDKSGWWMLILLIPIVGAIWMFVELGFLRGTIGANRFGSDPVGSAGRP